MSSTLATAIPLTLLVLFFVAGMPIGIALGVAGVLGLYLSGGADAALRSASEPGARRRRVYYASRAGNNR